jgi:UDP-N-acetylglucosamine---dolichyl-phosphate N-acetylglucosaminyltransferase
MGSEKEFPRVRIDRIMPEFQTVVVVMPAYNEAAVIASVLSALPERIRSMVVVPIVVDDGSTDATASVAKHHGALVLRHLTNLGVGAATITGLRAAQALSADVIVTMDSDGQHDPAETESLVRALLDGNFDVVIGSRILTPAGMPLTRLAANLVMNAVTFIVYGKIVTDSQSGFKVFSRAALDAMNLRSGGYEICSEIIGEIYRNKLSYKSVPIRAVYTEYSRAKGQHFLNGVNLILGLFMRLMRRV